METSQDPKDTKDGSNAKEDRNESMDEDMETSEDTKDGSNAKEVRNESMDEAELKKRRKMSKKDCQTYILARVGTLINNPVHNPMINLARSLLELQGDVKILNDECSRLKRVLKNVTRHQCKFLQIHGKIDKPDTRDVGAWIDLPLLAEHMPSSLKEDYLKQREDEKLQLANTTAIIPARKFIKTEPGVHTERELELVIKKEPEFVIKKELEFVIKKEPELVIKKEPELVIKKVPELVIQKVPELVIQKVPELVIQKVPELVIDKAPELVIQKVPELVIQKVPKIRTKKEPRVRAKKKAPKVIEVIDLTLDDDPPIQPAATSVRNTYKSLPVRKAYQSTAVRNTYQPASIRATYQSAPIRAAYRPTALRAYQATPVRAAYQATPVRATYQATPVRATYQATPVGTTFQATPVGTTFQATPVRTTFQATPVGAAYQATHIRAGFPAALLPTHIRAALHPAQVSLQPAQIRAAFQATPIGTTYQSTYSNLNRFVFSSAAIPTGLVRGVPPSFFIRPVTQPRHPAPVPGVPPLVDQPPSIIPPKPQLKISVDKNGLVLQWDMPPLPRSMKITGYELFGYQERGNETASSSLWKKIGNITPMPLPMSCTLTQFVEGFKYHFSLRAVVNRNKYGLFSDPASIMFVPNSQN